MFEATPSGTITANTSLDRLRDGNGVDLSPANFMLSDGGAINITVDLSGSTTIGDIITKFTAPSGQ